MAASEDFPTPDSDAGTDIPHARRRADTAIESFLSGVFDQGDVVAAKLLLVRLRNLCDYERLLRLAEALYRIEPDDATVRRLQAQGLIEVGLASVAIPVLEALAARLEADEPEFVEATGLLGRAWKQIFLDSADKTGTTAHSALLAAIAAYRDGHERASKNTWHGVNLLALVHRARQMGLAAAPGLDLKPLARQIIDTLQAKPQVPPDEWLLPTLAEASLGLGDWEVVEAWLRKYLARPDVPAFLVASTLRQFSRVWNLEEAGPRGRGLVSLLRARLLQLPKSEVRLSADEIASLQSEAVPSTGQLEAVLGKDGPKTYEWWMAGLRCARSVASIKRRLGSRVGTGFLVRAGDFGVAPADELLVLTNFHVVNREGQAPGVPPADAQVVFEATAEATAFDVAEIVWTSPPARQDSSLLRLRTPVSGVEPVRIAAVLPTWPLAADDKGPAPRVYVIGHPGGRELSFSFQDNELLGHEGPPTGKPPVEGVCRVHYRAPTEGGSSGSPVFNGTGWEVIALHHMGGQLGMPRLNGESGSYAANEGISIQCIIDAIRRDRRAAA